MERLTYDFCFHGEHCNQVKGADNLMCDEVCEKVSKIGCKGCPIAAAFDRLAAIENILGDDYDLERLRELVEADRDRRCVVLPRKPHYKVYSEEEIFIIEDGEIFEDYILEATIGESMNGDGNPCVLYETGEGISFTERDFGKTVFLTCEAAEAAMKARGLT